MSHGDVSVTPEKVAL